MTAQKKPVRPKWRRRRPQPLAEAAATTSSSPTPQSTKLNLRRLSAGAFLVGLLLTLGTSLFLSVTILVSATTAAPIDFVPFPATVGNVGSDSTGRTAERIPAENDGVQWYYDGRRLRGTRRASPRRKGFAAKQEAERRRKELWDKTCREIDEIMAQYHAELPRDQAWAIGAAYLRYSTRFQDSVADQLREILRHAVELKIFIPRELIFFDLAVRGFKNNRLGLNAMRAALKRKEAQVLLLFSTSRLFRKQYRTLAFVDEVHRGQGVRCIFVKSGVDTNDKQRWETILSVQAMVDQFVVTMNVANIQAAHQGQLEKRIVFGTLSYGYAGEPISGEFTKRQKPRCRIILDPIAAAVVQKIFRWYVEERTTLAEIIRRLNDDESIPLPPRSQNDEWTRLSVKRILTSTRYRGLWKYGACESIYLPEQDYTRQILRAEPLKTIQLDELRIVSDQLWYAAQVRLTKEGENCGRKPGDGDRASRPKLLNGLLVCPVHDRPLYVGGPHGRAMICKSCQGLPAAKRSLFTLLNRRLAAELTCRKLAELVRADTTLIETITAACLLEVESTQKPDPTQLTSLRTQEENLKRKIAFIRRTAGSTSEEEAEAEAEIKLLQTERAKGKVKLEQLEAMLSRQPKLPTAEEIRDLPGKIERVLLEAARDKSGENVAVAREIIELLTGGRIELFQMGERRAQRGWLQGRFQVRLLPVLIEKLTGVPATVTDEAIEVVIDYLHPVSFDEEAERAWLLYQQELLNAQIALELKCSRSKITKLLHYASEKHGVPLENGHVRRARLAKKCVRLLKHQEIADEVIRRYHQDELLDDIAIALNVDRNLVTAAVRWWHEVRGLPVPDGRTRRKSLKRKSRKDQDRPPDAPPH